MKKIDWRRVNEDLLERGFSILPPFLTAGQCRELKSVYARDAAFRTTIDMHKYGFGRGTYRYFRYPLPDTVQQLREVFYRELVDSANEWAKRLRMNMTYPSTFSGFVKQMRARSQTRPTPVILKYTPGDYNCMHQDINEQLVFPYQVVVGLCEHGKEYEGGFLVLNHHRPRRQTKPHVIAIPRGGAVVLSSNFHPVQGPRGFHRTIFKHGVSEIKSGDRYTLGITFHDFIE